MLQEHELEIIPRAGVGLSPLHDQLRGGACLLSGRKHVLWTDLTRAR